MLRLAFDFIITWRETRTRPNAYNFFICYCVSLKIIIYCDVNLNQIEIIVIKILNIYSFNKPQNSILC